MSNARQLAANLPREGATGRRNLIINGGFDVWQRGTSFTGAGYTSDRWIISTTESGTAITKTANRDKRNTLRVTFGSTISCNLDQRIEGFGNIGYNQQVTLSFYVRGSRATTTDFCRIRNHTTATTLETLTYDITTSWTKVTRTFSANNTWSKDDAARLYVFVADASSPWTSGDWVEFSDVQLEIGDTATPFEHRTYAEELKLCERYYQIWGVKGSDFHAFAMWVYNTISLANSIMLRTPMRTAPSVSIIGGFDSTAQGPASNRWAAYQGVSWRQLASLNITKISAEGFRLNGVLNAGITDGACGLYGGSDCYIVLGAEL